MLVLSRKVNQSIQVGDDITITVVHLTSNRVRIGIMAPKKLAIARDNAKQRTQQDARQGTDAHTDVYADSDAAIKEQTP